MLAWTQGMQDGIWIETSDTRHISLEECTYVYCEVAVEEVERDETSRHHYLEVLKKGDL